MSSYTGVINFQKWSVFLAHPVQLVSGRRLLVVEFVTFYAVGQRAFDDVVLSHVDPRTENDVAVSQRHY